MTGCDLLVPLTGQSWTGVVPHCIAFSATDRHVVGKGAFVADTVERKEYPISMCDAAVRAVEDAPMKDRSICMSPQGFAQFMEVLSAPAATIPEMVDLARRPAPWEAGHATKR